MNNGKKALAVVLLLVTLSFWGCSQKQNTVGNARVRDLEARNAKLEEDYRVVVGQRDLAAKSSTLPRRRTRRRRSSCATAGTVANHDEGRQNSCCQASMRTGEPTRCTRS